MDFASSTDRALVIRALYDDHERRNYGRRWSTEELTLGLVGDVGDLAIIVIAERCNVDLASSFAATMDEIEAALTA